jgi:flagellar biosynthesis/type III secretory pathway chaperone
MTINGWETLVDALRSELQEYGCLLNLFNEQQNAILQRRPDQVLIVSASIEEQLKTVNRHRKLREELVKKSAATVDKPLNSALLELMEFFPASVQPLFRALIEEVNRLLVRTKRRARQNQMLLARSIEVTQDMLRLLNPGIITTTYSRKGRLKLGLAEAGSRCLARS